MSAFGWLVPDRSYDLTTDEELVAMASSGNRSAYEELYRRYWRFTLAVLYRVLYRVVPADAEDANQEAWLRVLNALNKFDTSYTFKSWVYRIASNCGVDVIRRRRSHE